MSVRWAAMLFCFCLLAAEDEGEKTRACRVRCHNFTVPPSTGPVVEATVVNRTPRLLAGKLEARFPKGWTVTPAQQPVTAKSGEARVVSFTVEKGVDRKANVYPVVLTMRTIGREHRFEQKIVCASTPYYRPKIDGNLSEWKDAIPIDFPMDKRKTRVRTYWNKKQFCLAVEVEEEEMVGWEAMEKGPVDALQFSLAPKGSRTPIDPKNPAVRYEFLVIGEGETGRCFQLCKPGNSLREAAIIRPLLPPRMVKAAIAISRKKTMTSYEVMIPLRSMPALRATPGREYCFSLLVHDPDGTGVRDLGTVMNLSSKDRNPLSWCRWKGANWPAILPFDNKVEFGFCSSIH